MQDDLARILLQFVGEDQSAVPLTLEERAALEISRAAAERGDFADEAEVAALWAKHGL